MPPRFLAALTVAACVTAFAPLANAEPQPEVIPAKTVLHFRVGERLSSEQSTTGQAFSFIMIDPVVVSGTTLVTAGAKGSGTLLLAGHAGSSGHEGDLTLRLDSIPTSDGRQMVFDDQRLRINGKNLKIMSGVLGFIPFAGLGARFIRGHGVTIDPGTPISTVLDRPASTAIALPTPPPVDR